jgi:hypothetical protein
MGKSLYTKKQDAKLIYSYKKRAPCCVDDVCLTSSLLSSFKTLLSQVHSAVSTLFPALDAKSTFVANIDARACVPAPLFARLLWRRAHPGEKWTGDRTQVLQLLDIYLRNGMSYAGDPFFDDAIACLPGGEFPVDDEERAIVEEKPALDSTDTALKEVGTESKELNASETASGTSAGSDGDPQPEQQRA